MLKIEDKEDCTEQRILQDILMACKLNEKVCTMREKHKIEYIAREIFEILLKDLNKNHDKETKQIK